MNFGEQIYCTLSDKMSLEIFFSQWSHVNENVKKIGKNPKCKIVKSKKKKKKIVWRYGEKKFGINLLDDF